jgi:hypothetical protein
MAFRFCVYEAGYLLAGFESCFDAEFFASEKSKKSIFILTVVWHLQTLSIFASVWSKGSQI